MDWQTLATLGMVLFASVLLLRRLPWFSKRSVSGCSSCHGCAAVSPTQSSLPLVQLGTGSGRPSGV